MYISTLRIFWLLASPNKCSGEEQDTLFLRQLNYFDIVYRSVLGVGMPAGHE